jgi:hypothetical protein
MSKNGRHSDPNLCNGINSNSNYNLKKIKEFKISAKSEIGEFTAEGLAFDSRVELIAPAEATRLARSSGNTSRDQAPISRPKIAD